LAISPLNKEVVSMNKKIIALIALSFLCLVHVAAHAQGGAALAVSPNASTPVGSNNLVFDPVAIDRSALPELRDLPYPDNIKKRETARKYTGIIKNKTRYEVSLPSENSDATLIIPPHSWIEYTMWTRRVDVTAYRDGKPFYCLKLWADPNEYSFMCSKYDFMAEIDKPEPAAGKYKPMKKRKYRVKKQPQA
jgi:hypothetical protein